MLSVKLDSALAAAPVDDAVSTRLITSASCGADSSVTPVAHLGVGAVVHGEGGGEGGLACLGRTCGDV